MIKEIMALPEYGKSFNKAVNHALKFGVVDLYEKLFIQSKKIDTEELETMSVREKLKTPEDQRIEDYMDEIVKLLSENIMHLTLLKSMMSSMFNEKAAELGGNSVPKTKFEDGLYRRTPKYLESYENRALKNIRGDK